MYWRYLLSRATVALVAHDDKKAAIVAFATFSRDKLGKFDLTATSTTGRLMVDKVSSDIKGVLSQFQGGDA
jgi:methylglyoxal synthase